MSPICRPRPSWSARSRERERPRAPSAAPAEIRAPERSRAAAPAADASLPRRHRRGRATARRCGRRWGCPKPQRAQSPAPRRRAPSRCRKASPRSWRCSTGGARSLLRSHLASHLHLVRFEPGRIEFRPAEGAPRDLANRLGQLLGEWTGSRWLIAVSRGRRRADLARAAGAARGGAAERGRGPPVGSGGARHLPRRHDRRGPRALCRRPQPGTEADEPADDAITDEDEA